MKSEIANISNKLDTLLTLRETEDGGQFWIKIDTELSWSSERNILTNVKKKMNDFVQSLFYTQLWVGLLNWFWKCCVGEVLSWNYDYALTQILHICLLLKITKDHYLSLTSAVFVMVDSLNSFHLHVSLHDDKNVLNYDSQTKREVISRTWKKKYKPSVKNWKVKWHHGKKG